MPRSPDARTWYAINEGTPVLTWLRVAPYIVAALLVVGTLAFVQLQGRKIDGLTEELANARITNALQATVIDRVTKQRQTDDEAIADLVTEMRALREASEAQTQAIAELEKTDPDAKAYLSTPVPDSLKRVFGNNQAGP